MRLAKAIEEDNKENVIAMIAADIKVLLEVDKEHQTPLHFAARRGRFEILKVLLENLRKIPGWKEKEFLAFINKLDKRITGQRYKAIDSAMNLRHLTCVIALAKAGSDLQTRGFGGASLLHRIVEIKEDKTQVGQPALDRIQYQAAEELLKLGANPQMVDDGIDTPFHFIKQHRLPAEWWILFLKYGGGINFDFDQRLLPNDTEEKIKFCESITRGQFLPRATWKGKEITTATPGFKDAIFTYNNYLEYEKRGSICAAPEIITAMTKYIKDYQQDPDLLAIIKKMSFDLISLKHLAAAKVRFYKEHKIFNPVQMQQCALVPEDIISIQLPTGLIELVTKKSNP